jgi:hypothetical protein
MNVFATVAAAVVDVETCDASLVVHVNRHERDNPWQSTSKLGYEEDRRWSDSAEPASERAADRKVIAS